MSVPLTTSESDDTPPQVIEEEHPSDVKEEDPQVTVPPNQHPSASADPVPKEEAKTQFSAQPSKEEIKPTAVLEKPKDKPELPEKPKEETKSAVVEKPKEESKAQTAPISTEAKAAPSHDKPKDDPKPAVPPPAAPPAGEQAKAAPKAVDKPNEEAKLPEEAKKEAAAPVAVANLAEQPVLPATRQPAVGAKPEPQGKQVERGASTESQRTEQPRTAETNTEERKPGGKPAEVESPLPAKHDLPRKEVAVRPAEPKPENRSSDALLYVILGIAGAAAVGLFCCHVSVHDACYGPVATWDNWTCDMCREMGQNLACTVCPPDHKTLHKSPMRRCGPEKWVHLQCTVHLGVLFVPEVEIDPEDYRIPVKGVEDIDAAAMTIKCTLCNKRVRGLTVHCAEATCSESFHIQCALEKGYNIVEKHKLVCHQHFGVTPVPRQAPLPAYMIRTPQVSHSEKRGKSKLQIKPAPRPVRENKVEPEPSSPLLMQRSEPEVNCFSVVEEYFGEMKYQWLDVSQAPTGRESGPVLYSAWSQGLQKALLLSKTAAALSAFRTSEHESPPTSSASERDSVLLEPSIPPSAESQGPGVVLTSWRRLTAPEGEETELLGKCLEVCSASDEVTREMQFVSELLFRSILPTVNVLKQTLRRIAETTPLRLKLMDVKESQYQLNVATRWGFICRNFKAGLKDKNQEHYQKHVHVIEQDEKSVEVNYCDCCVCYNMDEDEYILNPIVVCSVCRLYVHRDCYGVKDHMEEFICHKCRDTGSPRCCLCGKGGGAMKKDIDRFFHLFCALIDTRVDFKEKLYLSGFKITGRSSGNCSLCGKGEGLLTQCEECEAVFHYFCAWHNGLLFSPSEVQDTNLRTVSAVRRVHVAVRCLRHSSEARDVVLQQMLRLKPYTYAIDKDKVEELIRPQKRLKRKSDQPLPSDPKTTKLPKTIASQSLYCEESSI